MDFGPPQQHWEQWGWDGDSLLADPSGPSSHTNDVFKMSAYSSLSLPDLPLDSDPDLQSTRPEGSRGTEDFWNSSPFESRTAGDDTCPNLLAGRVPCDCTRQDAELLNKLQCRRPDIFATLSMSNCQIQGCEADVSLFKGYHQRHRVCDEHAKAPSVVHEGMSQRYCQQCGRYSWQPNSVIEPSILSILKESAFASPFTLIFLFAIPRNTSDFSTQAGLQ